jgi:osmotically-inducible protein OsmY
VVLANDGVVTLSGQVASLPQRYAARRAPLRVWGVTAVADDMVVRDLGASGPTDADLAEAAQQLLTWAVDVPADTAKAAVHQHAITLSGTVAWQFQREAAARAVMYLRGVTAVTNTITLTPTAPASRVKLAVEAAILRNAQLDSRQIVVDANGGEVMLQGTVRSWAERRQAAYLAYSAAGVTRVTTRSCLSSGPGAGVRSDHWA